MRVFTEADPGFFISIGRHSSGRFGDISAHDHETSEAWLIDLSAPDAEPTLVAARQTGVQYEVEHHPAFNGGPALIIRTNADGAEDFKIVWSPLATPGRAYWRDLVPHRPGVYILSFMVLEDWLIRLEREDGLPRIVVRRLASGEEHVIAFAEEAYSLGIDGGYEFATNLLRFTYSSMTTPEEVWDYDLASRERILRKRQEIPSGHNSADYVTRRLFAPAADGETIPISLLYRKDLALDGTAPCLLYGYGAYGISIPAAFSSNRLSLVDRGFVYAIAHVRGGSEKGWRWYREGKLAKKMNTFTDFIAASEYLSKNGWCAPGKIVAEGGSAGGTLIGAVGNMRPDLYAGADRRSAFCRRAQHHARRDAAAHAAGMAGMGRSDPRRRGISNNPGLLALRERARAELSGDPRTGGSDRSARALLGAGEMDRAAAALAHGRQPDRLSHQPRRRSRRRRGPLRPSQGGGARLCLRDRGRGRGTVNFAAMMAPRGP